MLTHTPVTFDMVIYKFIMQIVQYLSTSNPLLSYFAGDIELGSKRDVLLRGASEST